ncbi:hypothetical protein FHG87_003672 [Trinorchestia longiramus]|nr:hypothetical protein FHG87_003672 [Trinorchestia longiramus]
MGSLGHLDAHEAILEAYLLSVSTTRSSTTTARCSGLPAPDHNLAAGQQQQQMQTQQQQQQMQTQQQQQQQVSQTVGDACHIHRRPSETNHHNWGKSLCQRRPEKRAAADSHFSRLRFLPCH